MLHIFGEAEEIGKLRTEVEERNRQLQTVVNGLTADNLRLKNKFEMLERRHSQRLETIKAQVLASNQVLEE